MKYFYEDILREIGEFGPWQKVKFLFLFRPVDMLHMLKGAEKSRYPQLTQQLSFNSLSYLPLL